VRVKTGFFCGKKHPGKKRVFADVNGKKTVFAGLLILLLNI